MHLPTEPRPAREASIAVARRAAENVAAVSLRLSDDQWRRLDTKPVPPGDGERRTGR
ncbi:MAG: hypothetical protein ACT4NY_15330 [Pseudonocardiales bacterium]